jgi:DNA-binding NtrC family response regulator
VNQGGSGEDLFYRISVVPVNIKPSGNIVSDIYEIAQHILRSSARSTLLSADSFRTAFKSLAHMHGREIYGN